MTAQTQFTPGPWRAEKSPNGATFEIYGTGEFCDHLVAEVNDADAVPVIEAAPGLYEALRTISRMAPKREPKTPEDGDDYLLGCWHCAEVARAALAKVTQP